MMAVHGCIGWPCRICNPRGNDDQTYRCSIVETYHYSSLIINHDLSVVSDISDILQRSESIPMSKTCSCGKVICDWYHGDATDRAKCDEVQQKRWAEEYHKHKKKIITIKEFDE